MILLEQPFLTDSSNHTKNPMTESKKFCMKGLNKSSNANCKKCAEKSKVPRDGLSVHDPKILDRYYTPKKVQIIGYETATKLERWVIHPLICCRFLIEPIFEFFFLLLRIKT